MSGGGGEAQYLEVIAELRAIIAVLQKQIAEQQERIEQLEQERDEYRKLYLLAREENAQLKRGLIGHKVQRAPENDAQLSLQVLGLVLGEEQPPVPATKPQLVAAHERQQLSAG